MSGIFPENFLESVFRGSRGNSRASQNTTEYELSRILHQAQDRQDNEDVGEALLSAVQRSVHEYEAECTARESHRRTRRHTASAAGDFEEEEEEEDDDDEENDDSGDENVAHCRAVHATAVYLAFYETTHEHGSKVFHLPEESVYSAALAIPQVARSSGWCLTLSAHAATVATLSILTLILQIFITSALHRASIVMANMSGKPNLCTYGTEYNVPGGPKGPFGVTYDPEGTNLETSHQAAYRTNIIWLALKRLGQDDLAAYIGPVELGIQSPSCRLVCMGVFCIAVMGEMRHCWESAVFLWYSPTTPGRHPGGKPSSEKDVWIELQDDRHTHHDAEHSLDGVVFKMNGMPAYWKWCWCIPVIALQSGTVVWVGYLGSRLLLATGAILDLILNSTALVFILEMDRIAYKAFVRSMIRDIMERLQPLRLTADDVMARFQELRDEQYAYNRCVFFIHFCSGCQHMFFVALLVMGYYVTYLVYNCELVNPPFSTEPILPWTHGYYNDSHSRFGGFDFWMGRWVSKNITRNGEVTCAPYRPDRPTVLGCGLPPDWQGN